MKIVIELSEKTYNALTHTEFDANLVVDEMRKSIANGAPVSNEDMDIPLSECQKAYDIAIDYLRKQGKVRG